MKKAAEVKVLHVYQSLNKDEREIINKLFNRINKNISQNSRLWVFDYRTITSHHWKGTTKAELIRRFGLTYHQLKMLMSYITFDEIAQMDIKEHQERLKSYQPENRIDYKSAIRWALSYLLDDYDLKNKIEEYGVNEETT